MVTAGLAAPVLVLNRVYQPVRITTARQAFEMLFMGRARALDESSEPHDFAGWAGLALGPADDSIGTTLGPLRVPRILLLSHYARVPRTIVRLSRRNVFHRDGHTCQYCLRTLPVRELNVDHVIPRSRGGPSTWENLVTSCRPCNFRKGGRLPQECGMVPHRPPRPPRWSTAVQLFCTRRRFAEWEPFLASGIAAPAAAGR